MGLIDTIVSTLRSLTGGNTRSTESADTESHREGEVSVEHDPGADRTAADTSSEAAIKGTDPETAAESGSDDETNDAVAAGTDAAASTGTLVDEDAGGEPAETVGGAGGVDVDRTATEVADDSEGESDDADVDEATDESEDAAETEDTDPAIDDSGTAAGDAADGEPVETITGIGPAYAGRLETVGIETVGELAAADVATVAEEIDVSESRVGDWIERARDAS